MDTEIIKHLFSLKLKSLSKKGLKGRDVKPDLFEVSREVMKKLDGAYSIIMQFADGDLVALRDPLGFKPLVWGESSDYFGIASESVALEKIGIDEFHSVAPGSCMIFNKHEKSERNLLSLDRKAHCHFERVYFARANSIIDGKSVNSTRENLGRKLAEIEPLKRFQDSSDYLVVPVPKTT